MSQFDILSVLTGIAWQGTSSFDTAYNGITRHVFACHSLIPQGMLRVTLDKKRILILFLLYVCGVISTNVTCHIFDILFVLLGIAQGWCEGTLSILYRIFFKY